MADQERRRRICAALTDAKLDAIVCALPMNVLMLSGYWPVLGTAIAVFARGGEFGLLVPEGEMELAKVAAPATIESYQPSSLQTIEDGAAAAEAGLSRLWRRLSIAPQRVGIEDGAQTVPAGYSAIHFYSDQMCQILGAVNPRWQMIPAEDLLVQLRAVKTAEEIAFIRLSCEVARKGFAAAIQAAVRGAREVDVALAARREFALPSANEGSHRADGFAWCMSGPNSSEAGYAFARSQSRRIQEDDVVLLHANSYLDGYWTDITRTFVCGGNNQHCALFADVEAARESALLAIRPGAAAKDVDAVARETFQRRGLADYFTHGSGHEVGFGAIDAGNVPRLHPASPDILEEGMVFNVEPALYLPGVVGVRHCDVVLVTETGYEVLTPWLPLTF
jgi:Xaa-Pro aminopeptidase